MAKVAIKSEKLTWGVEWIDGSSVEYVLTYAMFPKVAPKFFENRRDKQLGIDAAHADKENKVHPV